MADGTAERLRVLLLFGGQSSEHGVSCLSAANVLEALDPARYEVTTVGITRDGRWTLVEDVPRTPLETDTDDPAAALPEVGDDGDTVALVRTRKGTQLVRFPEHDAPGSGASSLGPVDVCFPVLHGPHGEDGTVQGLLATQGVPYVGADVASSAVGIDKRQMKNVFTARGLPQAPYRPVHRARWEEDRDGVLREIEGALAYPLFTKPSRQGSSIGIAKCRDTGELVAGIEEAFGYDRVAIVEQGVDGARELECALLGNNRVEVTPPGEVRTAHDFYDFEGKYLDEGLELQCPAAVPEPIQRACREFAREAYLAIGCRGMARVDFFYIEGATEPVLVNEINTIPGFTPASMFPYAWSTQGLEAPALVDRLLELALEAGSRDARYAP
ncbi:D-alanine--D-alanine ligase [Egibacter rhizosphaerae]|uniref:D-alanine--D-alanine ligase n=1 Tax=Egibacter rhizosphaerae TaxID=1670831 RepID=A0A411YCX2_9ACTN|nr:D-alanine--D-alanine ligase family protein [Egibacter rhizosphaerae]QBI18997.1 D-alanine--D-alanine ligase [Egibacter rhizosphaerae]